MPKKGQPVKFGTIKKERYLKLLREGGRRGASAKTIGIHRETVRAHMKADKDFAKAVNQAETEAHELIEDALFQAALAGNVTAQQVYLYNRMPDKWADRRRLEHTGKPGEPVKIEVSYEGSATKGGAEEAAREAG